jgi:hypothetical protein
MSEIKPSMEMPVQWQVVVTEMRSGAPWPVATVQVLEGGACRLIGSAAQCYAPLLNATKKAAVSIALQTLKEALQNDLHPSPAMLPETAASPEILRRDVPQVPSNEAADLISTTSEEP